MCQWSKVKGQMFHHNHLNHRKTRNNPNQKGYTLAEMVIVLGVMAILFTIGAQSYLQQRDRFEFNAALYRIMQLVRNIRTYATSTTPIAVPKVGNVIPVDGYGIQFKMSTEPGKSTLTTFANLAPGNPTQPHTTGDESINRFNVPGDVKIESYTIPKQMLFKKLWFQKMATADQPADPKPLAQYNSTGEDKGPTALEGIAFFKPPMADSWIVGFGKTSPSVAIPLTNLQVEFENPEIPEGGAKKCLKITLNVVKTFPELSYSNCQWK
jgi:prepilin-type N-terminal cleavage/methylation domain-containing protein